MENHKVSIKNLPGFSIFEFKTEKGRAFWKFRARLGWDPTIGISVIESGRRSATSLSLSKPRWNAPSSTWTDGAGKKFARAAWLRNSSRVWVLGKQQNRARRKSGSKKFSTSHAGVFAEWI